MAKNIHYKYDFLNEEIIKQIFNKSDNDEEL